MVGFRPDGGPTQLSLEMRGGNDLAKLGRRLKQAGGGELRRDLLRGIRVEVAPTVRKIPGHAKEILPRGGGLAALYASKKIRIRSTLSERGAAVRIVSVSPGRLRDVDAGRLRHPLFKNREHWYGQRVKPGWFSNPIKRDAPRVRLAVLRVMANVAKKIDRSVR